MSGDPSPDDHQQLLEGLRRAAKATDPLPPDVVELARAAFDWRTLDAELAALVLDSAEPSTTGEVLVRSTGRERLLTFEASDLMIELELVQEGSGEQGVRGQLLPPQAAELVVQHAGDDLHATADEDGRFALDGVLAGPVRIRVTPPGRAPVETRWTSRITDGSQGS